MVGQIVGKYRILSRIGRGGMGTVYKAVDETLDREVAIKSLNPDLSDPEVLKRFRAEAVTLARLNHPNIAMLFELAEHEGELLMVMEFVRGETFESLTHRCGPLPLERSRELCAQVLDALAHAHRAGIVHRDLKPANLMLTESGLVKVMDFGLARMAGTEHLTNHGFMVGTPAYMAPEQVLAEPIDGRADVYAIAVVLYRLLTSQLPFKADSGISMAHKQVHDAPTPVRNVRAELPAACEDIIGRALAKSPKDRFQTAEEFKAALAALSPTGSSTSIPVPSSGLTQAFTLAPITSGSMPVPEEPTVVLRSRTRTNTPLAVAIAALVLAGAPTTAYLVWRSRPLQAATPSIPLASSPASHSSAAAPPAAAATDVTVAAISVLPVRKIDAPTGSRDVSGRRGSSPPASTNPSESRPPLPSVSFAQIKLLLLDDKPRDKDVLVTFGTDALDVVDDGKPIARAPYQDVIGLFLSHSREPRWSKPDGTAVAVAKIGGRFAFLKGSSDWITVQTREAFIPLHVPDGALPRLISELETRTGTHVVTTR